MARKAVKAKTKSRARISRKSAVEERGRKKSLQKWKRYCLVIGLLCFISAGLYGYERRIDLQVQTWLQEHWLTSTASAGFRFKELVVEGRSLTEPQEIVDAVGLTIGDSLFMVSLNDIRNRLIALNTIRDAHVSRDLGGRIIVTLVEREPFALWQHRNRLHVVDERGITMRSLNPKDYSYLVTIVGDSAPDHIDDLVGFVAADKVLAEQVVAAVYVSDRRWDVHFANGVQILLPEINPESAWKKLAKMHREHSILTGKVESIDLRIDDRVFITLPEEIEINPNTASDA